MARKLTKSHRDKMLFGVCGGLGEYLDIDSTLVRLAFVVLAFASGAGIIAYIFLAIFVPAPEAVEEGPSQGTQAKVELPQESAGGWGERTRRQHNLIGIFLVVLGLVFLLANFDLWWWFRWGRLWPLILIATGAFLIFSHYRRR